MYEIFGQIWIRIPNGEWRRHLVRECLGCRRLSVQQLQYVDDESVFCMGCLGTAVRLDMVNGQRVYRCIQCGAVTEFDAFIGRRDDTEGTFFDPKGNEFFVDEFLDDDEDEENEGDGWRRTR